LQYVADHNAPNDIGDTLAPVLGDGVRVNAFRRRFLPPGSSGKFSLLKPLAK
jgi:phenylacetate-CoA ligase